KVSERQEFVISNTLIFSTFLKSLEASFERLHNSLRCFCIPIVICCCIFNAIMTNNSSTVKRNFEIKSIPGVIWRLTDYNALSVHFKPFILIDIFYVNSEEHVKRNIHFIFLQL
ncbi:hypothetical protein L9F63_006589, partial [Diploptera punctata]